MEALERLMSWRDRSSGRSVSIKSLDERGWHDFGVRKGYEYVITLSEGGGLDERKEICTKHLSISYGIDAALDAWENRQKPKKCGECGQVIPK